MQNEDLVIKYHQMYKTLNNRFKSKKSSITLLQAKQISTNAICKYIAAVIPYSCLSVIA